MNDHDLGVMLGKILASAGKPSTAHNVIELKTAPQVDATCIEVALEQVVLAIRSQDERKNTVAEATHAVREAIIALAEYMPQGADYAALTAAINNFEMPEYTDFTPHLAAVVAALDRNTAAVEAQTAVMMRPRVMKYDTSGKISEVSVK